MNVTPLIWSAFNALFFFKKTQESTMSDINAVTPNTIAIPEQNLTDSAAVNSAQPVATAAETPVEASPRDPMFDAPPARTIDAVEEATATAPPATAPAEKAADAATTVSTAPVETAPAAPEAVAAEPVDVAAEPAAPNADAAPAEPADVVATASAAPEAVTAAPVDVAAEPAASSADATSTEPADAAATASAAPVEVAPAAPEAVTAAPVDVAAEPAASAADASPSEPADIAATASAIPPEAAPVEIPPARSSAPTADNAVSYPSEADEQRSVHDAVTAGVNDFEQAFDFVEQGIARLGQAAKDELKLLAKKYL